MATEPLRPRVAYAVVFGGARPRAFLAADEWVLSRVIALHLVAQTRPEEVPAEALPRIREALLQERWADAVAEWMQVTGVTVDVYSDEHVWVDADLDEERVALELRVAPLFDDSTADPG